VTIIINVQKKSESTPVTFSSFFLSEKVQKRPLLKRKEAIAKNHAQSADNQGDF